MTPLVVTLLWASLLAARHLPQACRDLGNRGRPWQRRARPLVTSLHLTLLWACLHGNLFHALATTPEPSLLASFVGLVLGAAGAAIGALGLHALGRSYYTELAAGPDTRLVTDGIYRLSRHPMRVGLALETLGAVVTAPNWFSLACWVLLVSGQALRTRVEERLLRDHYGEPASRYQRSTPAVLGFPRRPR